MAVLVTIAARLKITLEHEEPERILVQIEQASALAGDVQIFSWSRRIQADRMFRCGNQRVRARRTGDARDLVWLNCHTRACDYCLALRAGEEAARLAALFAALDQQVFAVETTWAKSSAVLDYCTRRGHAAVVLPQKDGRAVLVTTMPRKDACPIVGVLEGDLGSHLQRLYEGVPAYTKAGEPQHRVRFNRHLRQVAEDHPEVAQGRQERLERQDVDDDSEWSSWVRFPEAALNFAVANKFPLGFNSSRQVSRISLVGVDPRLREEFEHLELGQQSARCQGSAA